MNLMALFENQVLIAVLIGWLLAQALKIPTEYLRTPAASWTTIMVMATAMPNNGLSNP